MEHTPSSIFDEKYVDLVANIDPQDPDSDTTEAQIKLLERFNALRPPDPKSAPTPVVPVTMRDKVRLGLARIWDNETTRVFIKAGGAFAGVATVAYTTIHKDHVIERQAIAQANQRPL